MNILYFGNLLLDSSNDDIIFSVSTYLYNIAQMSLLFILVYSSFSLIIQRLLFPDLTLPNRTDLLSLELYILIDSQIGPYSLGLEIPCFTSRRLMWLRIVCQWMYTYLSTSHYYIDISNFTKLLFFKPFHLIHFNLHSYSLILIFHNRIWLYWKSKWLQMLEINDRNSKCWNHSTGQAVFLKGDAELMFKVKDPSSCPQVMLLLTDCLMQ